MVTILQYAEIANAVYEKAVAFHPDGHLIRGWTMQREDWEDGSILLGNGFQGGIYQSETDVVVGFAGTKHLVGSDISADARIATNILPNQCTSAYKMVLRAQEILGSRQLSCCGHSLGGGLAQVIGVWCGIPFVTFNAPPMKNAMRFAKVNIAKPHMMARSRGKDLDATQGINFRVEGDSVSWAGMKHVGRVIKLAKINGGFFSHSMDLCCELIRAHADYSGKTILELSA